MGTGGRWVAIEATDDVRRAGIGLDTDDSAWAPIAVPGHWQHRADLAASDGPVMYRHRYRSDPPAEGRRRWVTFDGIFYQGDAWLDGAYLGDLEGYFFPHSFDVTDLSRIGHDHVLAIEVACPAQSAVRSSVTGVLQGWSGLPNGWNPGGLWRPVRCYDTGPVRIDRLRVLCRDADDRRAHVRLSAMLDSDLARDVVVLTRRDGEVVDEQRTVIASGPNELEWSVDIRSPQLWWPRELGDQPLTEFVVEVVVDGEHSDERARCVGLRQVDWNDWIFTVNGERVFLRGANLLPLDVGLADTSDDRIDRDLDLAIELGLNSLRVHGHISRRHLYDRADQLGLLLLQDFPLERVQARRIRSSAVAQAAKAVDQLGHHPSIVLWSAHNEPVDTSMALERDWRSRLHDIAAQQLPTWNKSVLDRWVKRAFERTDPTRPTIAHSGVLPHLPQLNGTDSHLWFGWRQGTARDLARRAARMPRIVRFVSEFGADSVPPHAPFIESRLEGASWPDLDWDEIEDEIGHSRDLLESLFPPAEHDSFDAWRTATQLHQAHVLRTQIETLRRLKYRPTGGFCFSSLADPGPAISSSVLDHRRAPKLAWDAVRGACAPVVVIADLPPDWIDQGDRLRLDVHLVNDRRSEISGARVSAVVSWPGGERRWDFTGTVGADEVVHVGSVDTEVPHALGELAIDLVATDRDGLRLHANSYRSAITVPSSG
ncbi:hypothetical protein [Ilumatobacter sp.]|uniref:hypothetical protein n=1 Tax=Ilumatobacter sp. TaxID=1967498 RepID=UPI003B519C3C